MSQDLFLGVVHNILEEGLEAGVHLGAGEEAPLVREEGLVRVRLGQLRELLVCRDRAYEGVSRQQFHEDRALFLSQFFGLRHRHNQVGYLLLV